ncbi:MAG: MGMT family protein [Bacteroidales bacterium]|nr:MGMT family protein [Bacteroidales bacterium]
MEQCDIYQKVLQSTDITEFQRRVYLELLKVPKGETITYGELGRRIGCKSAQAIGQALKRNPFAPDVPCHRVVSRNGIGGFQGERQGEMIAMKIRLLKAEGVSLE